MHLFLSTARFRLSIESVLNQSIPCLLPFLIARRPIDETAKYSQKVVLLGSYELASVSLKSINSSEAETACDVNMVIASSKSKLRLDYSYFLVAGIV